MKILITNDDGIHAEGIRHLVNWAKTKGEVTVLAPKVQQSGKSHSIEI
ncbi:MAG: 5'/3'-nucleotidase SurE, partial [Clostridia bacterium]|nr:5'/3'-nucleotidase SurE [Clostridia bacterium]